MCCACAVRAVRSLSPLSLVLSFSLSLSLSLSLSRSLERDISFSFVRYQLSIFLFGKYKR